MMQALSQASAVLLFLAGLFIFVLGSIALTAVVFFILDVTQKKHAIRRNFPVIGRFRYWFEHLGEFFRQYFFALDREELPFNRAERVWVYKAAKGQTNTVAFGSTRDLRPVGTALFVNSPYPRPEDESAQPAEVTIGPDCKMPYRTRAVFNISGMSFGAISKPAVLALSNGARMAGIWMNTGEGGLSPYHLQGGADLVFQIGTAKYGVRDATGRLCEEKLREIAGHDSVRMFEIKLSQGAKPGKGGILPGAKVTAEIAKTRGIQEGTDSISPNRHEEIESTDDLLDFIERIRNVTGKPVGIKAVIGDELWIEDLAQHIQRRGRQSAPDFITVDSADGGTGAAPMSLIDYMGLPVRESLPMVVDTLTRYGLRDRIKVAASGKMITPAEVAWALCAGADFVNSARGFLFSLGCIQALQCNKGTCPTGITTHNVRLQAGLDPMDKAERVRRYAMHINKELEVIARSCGVRDARSLRREHCRIVLEDGRSVPLSKLFPLPDTTQPQAA